MPKLSTLNFKLSTDRGLTLVEALIYVVLFSVIIGGGVASAFYLMQSSSETRLQALREAEANFVLRKIDHLLISANSVTVTASTLDVDGTVVAGCGTRVCLDGTPITSDSVFVEGIAFTHTAGPPDEVTVLLKVEDKFYETIRYLR